MIAGPLLSRGNSAPMTSSVKRELHNYGTNVAATPWGVVRAADLGVPRRGGALDPRVGDAHDAVNSRGTLSLTLAVVATFRLDPPQDAYFPGEAAL